MIRTLAFFPRRPYTVSIVFERSAALRQTDMHVSEDLSLSSYISIPDPAGASFGGSQMWFSGTDSRKDRWLREGACGLVAATDLLLFVSRRERLSLTPLIGRPTTLTPASRAAYLELIRTFRRRYPIFPKIGSFNIELPLFMNQALRRMGSMTRLRFTLLPTRRSLYRIVKTSLEHGYPAILLIPPKILPFTKMKGVPFYSLRDGKYIRVTEPIRAHFITVTGIHYPVLTDQPLYYEISSWGHKYYLNSAELTTYYRGACLPLTGSLFYLHSSESSKAAQGRVSRL